MPQRPSGIRPQKRQRKRTDDTRAQHKKPHAHIPSLRCEGLETSAAKPALVKHVFGFFSARGTRPHIGKSIPQRRSTPTFLFIRTCLIARPGTHQNIGDLHATDPRAIDGLLASEPMRIIVAKILSVGGFLQMQARIAVISTATGAAAKTQRFVRIFFFAQDFFETFFVTRQRSAPVWSRRHTGRFARGFCRLPTLLCRQTHEDRKVLSTQTAANRVCGHRP